MHTSSHAVFRSIMCLSWGLVVFVLVVFPLLVLPAQVFTKECVRYGIRDGGVETVWVVAYCRPFDTQPQCCLRAMAHTFLFLADTSPSGQLRRSSSQRLQLSRPSAFHCWIRTICCCHWPISAGSCVFLAADDQTVPMYVCFMMPPAVLLLQNNFWSMQGQRSRPATGEPQVIWRLAGA